MRRESANSIQDRFFNHKKIIVSVSYTSDVEFHLTMKEAGEDQERRKNDMTIESEILNKPYKSGIDKLKRKEEGEEKN